MTVIDAAQPLRLGVLPKATILIPGAKHRVFMMIGAAMALRDVAGEFVGGSGGSIAAAFAASPIDDRAAQAAIAAFDLGAVFDLPDELRAAPRHKRIGRAPGRNLKTQLAPVLDDLGHAQWAAFEHDPFGKLLGTVRTHRLGVQICALTVPWMSMEQADAVVDSGRFLSLLMRQIGRRNKPTLLTFPEDSWVLGEETSARMSERLVIDDVSTSIRHPYAFRPEVVPNPRGSGVVFLTDGALPSALNDWLGGVVIDWRTAVPETPTIVLKLGRDAKHPEAQAQKDLAEFPGYHVLRYEDPDEVLSRLRPAAVTPVKFDLTPEQQVALFVSGAEQTRRIFDPAAYMAYVNQHFRLLESRKALETDPVAEVTMTRGRIRAGATWAAARAAAITSRREAALDSGTVAVRTEVGLNAGAGRTADLGGRTLGLARD